MSNELSLKISGQRFEFFNEFNVSLTFNSVSSTFSFTGLVLNETQKDLFKPLSFRETQILFENEILITGTSLNTTTSVESNIILGNISGYSKTGVLEDCTIPISLYPLQSDGLSLREITERLLIPFGLRLNIDSLVSTQANKKYQVINAESEQKIINYITELAKQRNIIVTHNNLGNLLFTRLNANTPSVATYTEGMPSTKISLSVNGQGLHSVISVQKQASIETDVPGEQTISNLLIDVFRPLVIKQTTGDNDDIQSNAKSIRSSELRNLSLIIETDRFKWTDGKTISIIKPNNIIEVQSPSNFINNRTRFFVERVDYNGNNEGISAVLTCVLPEVYTGNQPNNIFV